MSDLWCATDVQRTVSPTRVLFVLPRMAAGGVERVTLNLIRGFQDNGVDCRLALGHARGELLGEARESVHVYEIAARGNTWFIPNLLSILRRYHPTHIITAFADVSLMTWLACRLARGDIAIVMGVHGTHQVAADAGGWRARFRYHLYNCLAKWAYRSVDAVVAVSDGVAGDVHGRYPMAVNKLAVILNPVFTKGMSEYVAHLPRRDGRHAPYRLVAVGRLAYEKGFDVLLRALPMVLRQYPVHLDIYGEGGERGPLTFLVETMGLSPAVTLRGNTLDPLTALAAADVFVFPSRHEGFGLVLVEALACSCQIVASNCPHGPSEILQRGRLGQLVPPGDVHALAAAICRSLSGEVRFDPAVLSQRAADFSAETSVAAYLRLLGSLPSVRR